MGKLSQRNACVSNYYIKVFKGFFLSFKIITKREEGSSGGASKPPSGTGEWGVVNLAKGVSPSGSSPAGHCAANVPALVTSNLMKDRVLL